METKILLVEDHEIVRQGLRALLERQQDIKVIGEASNGAEAVERLHEMQPDVVLMDMNMPVMNGLECTKLIRKKAFNVKILILSMHSNENYLTDMINAGADGYILKNSSREELLFAIQKVISNSKYIGSEFAVDILTKQFHQNNNGESNFSNIKISIHEREVLLLIAEGFTNAEIAKKLITSIRTIETRRKRLLEKTGTNNTATLIRYAVKNGLIN
jgi:DNA-binding NarL/FixJ family response regulator